MLRLVIYVAALGLWIYSLVDVITTDAEHVRNLPKPLWIILIAVGTLAGAISWLIFGRARGGVTVGAGEASPTANASSPVGPDDDPDFLRKLDRWRKRPNDGDPPSKN